MGDMQTGFTGKFLRLDLSSGSSRSEELDPATLRKYMGGTGIAARILYDEQPGGIDPLSPQALFVIATGPLTRKSVPGGGSVELCFKSPLTGGWGESRAGGDFGPDLRRAGFEHLVVSGKAKEPVYAVIRESGVELKSAAHLSGKTVSEKLALLRNELSDGKYSIGCIGPGGERKIPFAGMMFGDRAAGRCGAGAVLGSKNLLAIAVKGTTEVGVAEPDHLKELLKASNTVLRSNPVAAGFHDNGTIGDLGANDEKGDWPTMNWRSNSWGKGAELLERYQQRNFLNPYPCYTGCTIACGRKVSVPDGRYKTPVHGGAEYESISCFTAYVLNEDMDAAVHCTWLCNEYGIDTISTGTAIAFALECAEKGLLPAELRGDLDLRWGNPGVLPILVKLIATREGLGSLLADGVRAAAERLGPQAKEYAVHVKGLEGPAHDGRSGKALAVSYGTANRGMCHIHPAEAMAWDSGKMDWGMGPLHLKNPEGVDRWAEKDKGQSVKLIQDGLNLPDILGTCKFFMYAGVGVQELASMLASVTGWKVAPEELLEVSERAIVLQRLFNLREGFTALDDQLPARVRAVPAFGKYAGQKDCGINDFPSMLRDYYKERGWDAETGIPGKAVLERLGLV
jgi:aldehyde:ferredoxin oxidoreductase